MSATPMGRFAKAAWRSPHESAVSGWPVKTQRQTSRAAPFTVAAVSRAIKGVERAGKFVVGVRLADGTLIVANNPLDTASLEQRTVITSGETPEDLRKLL